MLINSKYTVNSCVSNTKKHTQSLLKVGVEFTDIVKDTCTPIEGQNTKTRIVQETCMAGLLGSILGILSKKYFGGKSTILRVMSVSERVLNVGVVTSA